MAKKTVYKPKKGGFDLNEKKSLKPYGEKTKTTKEKKK